MTQPPSPPNEPPKDGDGTPPSSPFAKNPEPGPTPAQAPQTPQAPQSQPPAGGFGAPTPPPPGGFGAPTPPPPGQQPGYGYPQAPGQPPQAPQAPATPPPPAGYGYPGQQPPPGQQPYGQPGQPDSAQQPPAYGYPGQPHSAQQPTATYGMYPPQAPTPPPGRSGGGGLTTQLKIIIAAVVALVLIVGGGVVYKATSGDDPKDTAGGSSGGTDGGKGDDKADPAAPKAPDGPGKEKVPGSPASKVKFQIPIPVVKELTSFKGSWITDKVYAKPHINSVIGYDIDKGTQLWKIPLPGAVCGSSRWNTADNTKGAILFEGPKEAGKKTAQCTQVGLIDLVGGKLLWQKQFMNGDRPASMENVTISGNTVAAATLYGGGAFDLTGKELWSPKPTGDNCKDKGYAGGPHGLVALRYCGDYDSPKILVQTLNPASGKDLSTFTMPAGADKANVLSVKPLVVAADVNDSAEGTSGMSDIFSVDAQGKQLARIPVDGEKYDPDCDFDDIENCSQVAVGNNKVYLPTLEHQGKADTGRTNEIVAFDLTTGKPTADRMDAGERYSMYPLQMDGGNLIVYKTPPYDKGGQVVSIDGGSLKQTVLLDNPADRSVMDAEREFSFNLKNLRYANGRLFLSHELLSEDNSTKKYLAVVFGTG
ncbi:hypothetical protein [Streptomyces sp. NPDC058657]|uniref:hypothetical protein n=1 Tax=unclassified Streptomyces TaxID=2593676 RepID=UPI0036518289